MRCPNCDMLLITDHRVDIEIDTCPSCQGVWLDRGELNAILDRWADLPLPTPEVGQVEAVAPASGPDQAPGARRAEPSFWMTVLNAD
ncbi:TFIIB-type zinc ribbon-containing protein [Tautonia marina]|uniref:TFIIB-type zinc ribbon-containing protein n=1 Tax=Tautonia marina TaxID=2653855 RepID=UPI001260EA07|nr:zf-TFIIB domain-containing protein [Tautonia marina]